MKKNIDNYKNYTIKYKDYLTRNQWFKKGYEVIDLNDYVIMWSNRCCVHKFRYYSPSNVYKLS